MVGAPLGARPDSRDTDSTEGTTRLPLGSPPLGGSPLLNGASASPLMSGSSASDKCSPKYGL